MSEVLEKCGGGVERPRREKRDGAIGFQKLTGNLGKLE
jgi:hypothetical protein